MNRKIKKIFKKYNGAAKEMKFKKVSSRSIYNICTSNETFTTIAPEKLISAIK